MTASPESTTPTDPAPRYSYRIDPDGDTTANKVLRLVGEDRRVLELGCGPGAMTRFLHEHSRCRVTAVEYDPELARHAEPYCERLILGDLETLNLAGELGEARFDAVIAADVLEHLRDPWACLRSVRGLIAEGGVLIVSIPNVAHNAVIAQLLAGRFPYTEQGLLDRTHLRFFSRHDVEDLLLSTGFLPTYWERNQVPPAASEFARAWQALPESVREVLAQAQEGETYQYIVKAHVSDAAGWVAQARAGQRAAEREQQRLLEERDQAREYIQAFHEARDIIADRDKALAQYTQAFHEARDQLEERIRQLDEVNQAFGEARDAIARLERDRADLQRALNGNALVRFKKLLKRWSGRS